MRFERRTFLQQAGLTLLSLGISQSGLFPQLQKERFVTLVNRYSQALAASTNRKLALLVGINNYARRLNLQGCATDVELQRELLIHRFGFQPADILTLTGAQATREAIETAFVEHLSEQAIATDVVIFHFSGYGSRVKVPQLVANDQSTPSYKLVNSLVASGTELSQSSSGANDLLEETLLLLGRSLSTEKFTMVLDTSHHNTSEVLQGNLRIRSFPTLSEAPSLDELAFAEHLKEQIKASKSFGKRTLTPPRMILRAAQDEQIATEAPWNGFSAGLFTYALTQYLWQVTSASKMSITLTRTVEKIAPILGNRQQPWLVKEKQPLLTYFLPDTAMGAEGVITAVEEGTIAIKLAGLPAAVLENYGLNSCLTLVPSSTQNLSAETDTKTSAGGDAPRNRNEAISASETILRIWSREGLIAKARLLKNQGLKEASLKVGQLVQEYIRVIPRHLGLTVALDPSLERIERVDATSAFSGIPLVSSVVVAGEQAADCLWGQVKETSLDSSNSVSFEPLFAEAQAIKEVLGRYGLFSSGGVLISNTADVANEAVKSAVQRLIPQLTKLLAAKLWRLTLNEGSSRLNISATLEKVEQTIQPLIQRETSRINSRSKLPAADSLLQPSIASQNPDLLLSLPIGSRIQYRLKNDSDRPLYFFLLGLDSGGNAIAFYSPPLKPSSREEVPSASTPQIIFPGETIIVPHPSASLNWIVSGPTGLAEIQVIFATASFTNTLETLAATQYSKGDKEQVLDLLNPLEVTQALMQDLHVASAVPNDIINTTSNSYTLDVNAWATLSFVYQVI